MKKENDELTGQPELSERRKMILKAVVDAHIAFGEPVGSKYIAQTNNISYSPATIRSEMAELESLGYLEQPHTSAGRIPSQRGYRFYVDSLIERYRMTAQEIERLREALKVKQRELDGILQTAIKTASAMTNYTALAVKPKAAGAIVRRFDLILVDEFDLVLVMIMASGVVKTRSITSQRSVTGEAAAALALLLNEHLTMSDTSQVTLPVMMEIERAMGEYDFLVSPIIKCIYETACESGGELRFEGMNRLLAYPEYYDHDRLRDMLELFERKDDLLDVISSDSVYPEAADGVHVYIGSENTVKIMDSSTLIFKPVMNAGHTVGAIGIIGPTRMDYKRVISMIDHLSSGISSLISGNDENTE